MLPETFQFINELAKSAVSRGIEVLVEIHSHYEKQIGIGKEVDYVYDFALPPLVLHTLFTGDIDPLINWLRISPRNCFTVLDTHDGIGIIDAAGEGDKAGLLDASQIAALIEEIHQRSQGESRIASGEGGKNLDVYQINCSYYSALGADDHLYLLARAIQFFCPGIPQVYYGGFLAQKNDMKLLKDTGVHRDINRPYLTFEEINEAMNKPVVKKLSELIQFRNEEEAFDGEFMCRTAGDQTMELRWENGDQWAQLSVDGDSKEFVITYGNGDESSTLEL